jgi:broad specificity phosphatase PhoE
MRLLLIRHAEALQSINHIISGPKGCQGLTRLGFQQAHVLSKRLHDTGEVDNCTKLLSSTCLRTRQTAESLRNVLPVRSIKALPGLCELLPGESDGMLKEEAVSKYGSFDLMEHPDRPVAPGGESWNSFKYRARATLRQLAEQYENQTVVAVTHAGFIVISTLLIFDIPRPGTGAYLDPNLTGITEWQVTSDKWTLVRYNDFYHLTR